MENENLSRLDRIEANLEKFTQAIGELKNTQSKTDEQISELRESQKQTDEQLKKTIKKLDEIGKQLGDLGFVLGSRHPPLPILSSNYPKIAFHPI